MTDKNGFPKSDWEELISSREYESVEDIVRAAISEVKKFRDGTDQVEDMTLLAVEFLRNPEETGGPKLELTVPNSLSENARVKEHFDTFCGALRHPE